jgi:hypothetical protein
MNMRIPIFILLLISVVCLSAYGQPCREAELVNGKQRAALEAYIIKMEYLKLLPPDKGIVLLRRSTDSLFQEQWYLVPTKYELDKRKSHLPQQYYRIKDRIVLVWDDDNRQEVDPLQKQLILSCLDSLLKDKVLPFQYVKEKWVTREEAFGTPRSDPRSQEKILTQSFDWPQPVGSVIFVFNKDGTFKSYAPM